MTGNSVLRSLPPEEADRLEPYLKVVPLVSAQRLCSAEEPLTQIWFPHDCVVARTVNLVTGETIEAGIHGYDSVIGLPVVLGGVYGMGTTTVLVGGNASVMTAADFAQHVRVAGSPLFDMLLIYINLYIGVLGQIEACHALHRIEQRLSRCMLTLHDYAGGADLCITHDALADLLGVHRPSITYALQSLAAAGAISSERRKLIVQNRAALEATSCECYNAIRHLIQRDLERIATFSRP